MYEKFSTHLGKLVTALLTLSVIVGQTALASNDKLVLTGSSTIAPLASEFAKRFEELNRNVQVDVQSGGSSRGVNDARLGLADIGMVSRSLNSDELDLKKYTVAYDGISIILHRDNSLQSLTDAQIVGIYTGLVKNWRELGGPDLPITVVNKAEGRSTLDLFLNYFRLKNSSIKAHVIAGENQQVIKTVMRNRGAIGYVSIGTAEYEQHSGTPIKLLPMAGVAATTANVRNGTFPLVRELNFVTKSEPVGLKKRFIEFARSSAVLDLIRAEFFVAPDNGR